MSHLFVYGTLRRGIANKFAQLLAERGQFIGEARVLGQLYDFGLYPGARHADRPDDWILGQIFRLDQPDAMLALLDEYEGSEFERAMAPATHHQGHINCWIYWYVGDAPGVPIPSGDWLKH